MKRSFIKILFKYFLSFCLFQKVLSQVPDCQFPEHHPENQVANNLINDKEACTNTYVECINTADETCFETYNNCLQEALENFKEAAVDYDLLIKLFMEAQNEADVDCNALCLYDILFKKLLENHIFCG
ncbi:uncharacterized protein LOC119605775 [Lucilia sericata]|uniref:uncharacterized protein LOC119605775 n=1 Tax=Lucilia sericata TaxID=13632 RepID=UPI0018A7F0BE|nr:uncharacterized protein LOC119605775 [Lucilia sericata]